MEMDSEQYFVRVNSSCARLNSTIGWGGGIYFFNLDAKITGKRNLTGCVVDSKIEFDK